MDNRKEEKKIYSDKRKQNTIIYKKLLNDGKIQLLISCDERYCHICCTYKAKTPDNYYVRYIVFDNNNYVPIYTAECIECLKHISKKKGKLYKESLILQDGYRKCRNCGDIKILDISNFYFVQRKYYKRICINCCRSRDRKYKQETEYVKNKLHQDPIYKLRSYASRDIRKAIKKNGSSKNGLSITKYLPYAIEELKQHLESQFEDWMTWDNWGVYQASKWDDNDLSTWKWQLDHIEPQSKFSYTSMDCDEFRKCWALSNLRPYSAKQNNQDRDRKVYYE